MTDLQCAATLLLGPAGAVAASLDRLTGARVAHVWCDGTPESSAVARRAGQALGVGVTDRPDVAAALDDVADLHRGETVLVVAAGDEDLEGIVEVLVDADGRVVRPWGT